MRTARPRGTAESGARRATGDVLLFLHADTWLSPDGCRQIEAALEDERILCGAFAQCIQATGRRFRLLERGNAWRVRRWGLPYGDQGIFVRRGTFEQLGGFPEVPLMEDWLLMRRLRRLSWPVLLPGPLHVERSPLAAARRGASDAAELALVAAATAGVSPDTLARFYAVHSETAAALQPEQRHA